MARDFIGAVNRGTIQIMVPAIVYREEDSPTFIVRSIAMLSCVL
jgi:hypothetical protein